MSSHHKRSSKSRKAKSHHPAQETASDVAIYIGLLMIGAFAVLLAWVFMHEVMSWTHVVVGYVIAMAVFINLFGWQAVFGKQQANWQNALARLPLRFAGYGTKGGKPLAAAKGQPDAKMTLMLFGAGSVLLIAALTVWLVR